MRAKVESDDPAILAVLGQDRCLELEVGPVMRVSEAVQVKVSKLMGCDVSVRFSLKPGGQPVYRVERMRLPPAPPRFGP